MRSLILSFTAFLIAAPALAQDQSIQVPGAQQIYKLQPQQMDEIAGVYRFDSGGALRITRVGNRLMAQLGDRAMTELVAQADNRFISRDQRMTIDYIPQAFGDQIDLRYPSDLAQADSPMVNVRLAAN